MTIVIVVTLALLLANAICVAAEFAVIGVSRPAVEFRANQGDALARRVLRLLISPVSQDRFIATAQLGITLASLGLGMYGEHTLAAWLEPRLALSATSRFIAAHTLASIAAVTVLTYLHIFIGEMVPKAIALSHAEVTARVLYWPMLVVLIVFYPFVRVLNGAGNLFLRLIGIRRQDASPERGYTPEELQIIVEESAEGGAMRAESGAILGELLEFGDLTAGQVMVPRVRVVGIPVNASPDQVRATVLAHRHTRYPIFDGDLDHIAGMLHVKDLLHRNLAHQPISDAALRPMPVVPETATLDVLLQTMQKASAHLAVVIDEHGGTAGVVSLEDLFEEVVGEIDEGAPTAPPLVAAGDGSVSVAGTLRLDELGGYFDLDLVHEEVDSISGLVLARLGRPARVGDAVEYGRVRIEVTATSGHGVSRARVILLAPPEP